MKIGAGMTLEIKVSAETLRWHYPPQRLAEKPRRKAGLKSKPK